MISEITDRAEIIRLWAQAFEDSEEDIVFFLDNCNDYKCVGIYDGAILASMLFLVGCRLKGAEYKYIYAACTDKRYRNNGLMTDIICQLKHCNICLIPASDSLVDYYKLRGFTDVYGIEYLNFEQTDEITEYLFDGYELTKPCVLARKGD